MHREPEAIVATGVLWMTCNAFILHDALQDAFYRAAFTSPYWSLQTALLATLSLAVGIVLAVWAATYLNRQRVEVSP